jgi:CRP-like cAMP-binding protein
MSVATMWKGHRLFESLRFEDVDRINSFSGIKELSKDEFVFEAGKTATHLYVVLEGKLHLRLTAQAHETSLIVGTFEKGDFFGLASLVGVKRHNTSAQCAEPCKVLAIEAAPLRELLKNETLVGYQIMRAAARTYFSRYMESLRRIQRVVNDLGVI